MNSPLLASAIPSSWEDISAFSSISRCTPSRISIIIWLSSCKKDELLRKEKHNPDKPDPQSVSHTLSNHSVMNATTHRREKAMKDLPKEKTENGIHYSLNGDYYTRYRNDP